MVERREGPKVEQKSKEEIAAERAGVFESKLGAYTRRFSSWFNPDLHPDDDAFDPETYNDSDIKNAVAGVRTFVREYPREVFLKVSEFPVWLKHAIERETIGELAVADEDDAFELFRQSLDLSTFTDTNSPEENEAMALKWMARSIAPRMLLDDSEKGIDFVRRRLVSSELVKEMGESAATLEVVSSFFHRLLDSDPERAYKVFEKTKESGADVLGDIYARNEKSFLNSAATSFLDIDPDKAVEIREGYLQMQYENDSFRKIDRDRFGKRVQVARAALAARSGDVVEAFSMSKDFDLGNNHNLLEYSRKFFTLLEKQVEDVFHERKHDDLDAYDLEQVDELEYSNAKEYVLTLPDDIPGFANVCLELSQVLNREVDMRTKVKHRELYPDDPKPEWDEEKYSLLREDVYQELAGDIPELRWVNDNGVVKKTPEETLEYLKVIVSRAGVRQTLLKKVELSALNEIEGVRLTPEFDGVRRAVFTAQKDIFQGGPPFLSRSPSNKFYENFADFGDLVQELESVERDLVLRKALERDSYSVIFATEHGLRISGVEVKKVLEGVVKNRVPLDLFFTGELDFFYEHEGISKDEVFEQLIEISPEKFFSAFLATGSKEGVENLSDAVSSLMMKRMIEVNPIKLINFSEKVEGYDKTFSEESVQLGYASLFKKIHDGHHGRVGRIQEFTGIAPDWRAVAKLVSVPGATILELESYAGVDERLAEQMPWAESLKKLAKIQGHTANETHDPWKTDLTPLVKRLLESGVFSYERAEDGELLVKFVREYGMINVESLVDIYVGLERGDGLKSLSPEKQRVLVEAISVGIDMPDHKQLKRVFSRAAQADLYWPGVIRPKTCLDAIAPRKTDGVKKGEEQFAPRGKVDFDDLEEDDKEFVTDAYHFARAEQLTSAQLLHEVREVRRASVSGFLEDEVPPQLKTGLGQEIFAAAVGGGHWVAAGELGHVIDKWEKTVEEKPELAKLPKGYKEETIKVEVRSRKDLTVDEVARVEQEKERILKKKALKGLRDRYKEALKEHGSEKHEDQETDHYFWSFRKSLENKVAAMEQKKGSLHGKALESVEKRLQEIQNMRAFYEKLRLRDFFKTSGKGADGLPASSREYPIRWMEQAVAGGAKGPEFDSLLLRLSVRHVNDTIRLAAFDQEGEDDHGEGLPNGQFIDRGLFLFEDNPDELSEEEFVTEMGDFIEQYVVEHYLHPQQVDHHTGHLPFSDELVAALGKAWSVGKGAEKNAVVDAKRRLDDVNNPKELSAKKVSVAMVPGQGLPRIMSGDTGDACTINRHSELAEGKYPDVHGFTYVLGRGTPQERFAGSTLFVEGELERSEDNVILVRANNPRENLIQSVDNVSFTLQSLEKAIATAERTGAEEVLVPLDPVTASSSNRSGVSDVYNKYFANNPRRALKETDSTSFNGYDNWNARGRNPCVVIWTKKDGKINWPKPKPDKKAEAKKDK